MRRDLLFLSEMIDATERILELVGGIDATSPEPDRDRVDALLWNFTVLGEASNQVSEEVKATHSDILWADPVRLRNRIVHGYWSVDLDVLVATARDDLPQMLQSVRAVRQALAE